MSESKPEKQNQNGKERKLGPELLKKGLRCDLDQYEMLKRCSNAKDVTKWNQWRKDNPNEDIWLEGKPLKNFYLQQANFMKGTRQEKGVDIKYSGEIYLRKANFKDAKIQGASFSGAHLEETTGYYAKVQNASFRSAHLDGADLLDCNLDGCNFNDAILIEATLSASSLKGTKFTNSDLRGCHVQAAIVDGSTRFWKCHINRYSKNTHFTDLTGVPLDNVIIDPATKQLLEYNIRRQNWEKWYEEHPKLKWPVKAFWWVSDYGLSTSRIVVTFFALALIFAIIYYLCGRISSSGIVENLFVDSNGVVVAHWLVPLRTLYFSVVTMTTLGFGDMYANAQSIWGHILLSLQVILGYVLLGALVTRFAVLFTASGPAGKFADDKEEKTKPAESEQGT